MGTEIFKSTTLIETTYANIKKDILENYFKPGSKIVVRELSERYTVSETPIKQALNRLVMEGLVESIPRRGMKVKSITWSEIDDILEMRLMMDLYFVKPVMDKLWDNKDLHSKFEENIKKNLEYAETSTDVSEYQIVYQLDYEFHDLYLKCCGNKKAVETYERLNTHTYSNYIYRKQPRLKTIEGVKEHQLIYDALCERDEEKAKHYIKLHAENAKAKIYQTLKSSGLI